MKELIFSIKDIFNGITASGCLSQYDAEKYHIPAYQRGYKWSSEQNGAVSILLDDLWTAFNAFERNEKKEYFLQYITVKRILEDVTNRECYCLEVIDGQQRLTTLSILISVLSARLSIENVSSGKLHYAIRDNFFSEHIYPSSALEELLENEWDQDYKNTEMDKQDIFYMFSAAKKIDGFFDEMEEERESFCNYLLYNVKLIVNSVEPHVQSEVVFKNLNSNKVALTEVELIKGLMITKVGRGRKPKYYKEIIEVRANLGRQWDEIASWANQPDIQTFYFNRKEGMQELLHLAALCLESKENGVRTSKDKKELSLFNFFNKISEIDKAFVLVREIYKTLNDWYLDDKLYNLIGFCRFVKGSSDNSLKFLRDCFQFSNKDNLKDYLGNRRTSLLPQIDIELLRYNDNDSEIHAALLYLSVFYEGLTTRFNFHLFVSQKWSLEHIFPQSPEGKNKILNDDQKNAIREMLGVPSEDVELVLQKQERTESEKEVYYNALKSYGPLNSIGNMCLLTGSDNSSNGCMFFPEKRTNILELIQKGSFVPKHTFDVFSKMIPGLESNNMGLWSGTDIENHQAYIKNILA